MCDQMQHRITGNATFNATQISQLHTSNFDLLKRSFSFRETWRRTMEYDFSFPIARKLFDVSSLTGLNKCLQVLHTDIYDGCIHFPYSFAGFFAAIGSIAKYRMECGKNANAV